LTELDEQAEKGLLPTKEELRVKIQKLTPRKEKAPKKVTSGKGKKAKKAKPELPPYEPPPDEQSKMDSVEDGLVALAKEIKETGVFKIVAQCDKGEKKRWLDLLLPLATFYNDLDRITGY
jgi:hypothetical protein